jgi:hypothetical protein
VCSISKENIPSHDLVLVAPTTQLVAKISMHPALIDLLLQAATKVHHKGGGFIGEGAFPSPKYLGFKLSTVFLRIWIANQAKGVIMSKAAWIVGFLLMLSLSSLLQAGDHHGMRFGETADTSATEHGSDCRHFAKADSMKEKVPCMEPRPQVCTQDYRPVCAELQDGSFKTFFNGCSACSDAAVTGYRDGACE